MRGKHLLFAGIHGSSSADTPATAPSTSSSSFSCSSADTTFAAFVKAARQKALQYGVIELGTDSIVVLAVLERVTVKTIFRLAVFNDFTWQLEYRGQKLEHESTPALSSWPKELNSDTLDLVLRTVLKAPVCKGHEDLAKVLDQCAVTGKLVGNDRKTVIAYHLDGSIRHPNCSVLMLEPTVNGLCEACGQTEFRNNLRARESYLRKEKCTSSSKFTPNANLTECEKKKNLSRSVRLSASYKED